MTPPELKYFIPIRNNREAPLFLLSYEYTEKSIIFNNLQIGIFINL